MRISTERGDPGFRDDALMLDISIWLNGIQQHNAVMADTGLGVVKVWTKDYGYVEHTGHVEIRNHDGKVVAATPKGHKPKPVKVKKQPVFKTDFRKRKKL